MASPYAQLKEEAWLANVEIPARGLALYTWGNVSAFDPASGVFAIKPSGVPYNELCAEDMVVIDLDGARVEGRLNPSSDTSTHRVLYCEWGAGMGSDGQRSPIGGIIHTHSAHAVAWAQAGLDIPLFGTTHADHIQTPVPCTPFLSEEAVKRDYELETGHLIVRHFGERSLDPAEVTMVLVGGHGPFAWGKDASKAVYNGRVLEEIARMALMTLELNPAAVPLPAYIVSKHYNRKHGSGAYYGQK
ncbi:MAG: L-ribulose-5-phosphate 4-epimerase AraD [Treponema sp.]|nr:MAG: L-ribulose-5-phosphate 4-epimerase AraD [Treponema sp.]